MNRVFPERTRLIQITLSASLQPAFHGFSHRVMALCRHTASAENHDHRPQTRRVLTVSGAMATVAYGTGAPLSGSTAVWRQDPGELMDETLGHSQGALTDINRQDELADWVHRHPHPVGRA